MKTLKRNTESILYEKAKSIAEERLDIWRCIHLRFSVSKRPTAQLQFIGRIISDLLSNEEGYIYLCDDGDVFILFKGALKPILRKLSHHFEDFDTDYGKAERKADDLVTIFDLGQNWHAFFDLCRIRAFQDTMGNNQLPAHELSAHHQA